MTLDIIKYAFVAGEVSPAYYGRSDLEKFDLALAEAENWFVDYHGGLSTVPGTQLGDYVKNDDYETRFIPFKFSSTVANSYMVLFGKDYIRFIQSGSYVLEEVKTVVSFSNGTFGSLGITAHGFSNGDWIKFVSLGNLKEFANGTFEVLVIDANNINIKTVFSAFIDTTDYSVYTSGATVARVYTIASPYADTDLRLLRAHQIKDVIRLTSNQYAVKNLRRISHTNWTLTDEVFSSTLAQPTGLTLTPTVAGSASVGFMITQVNGSGEESLPSNHVFNSATVNYSSTAGAMVLNWTPVTGAVRYNIYRTRIVPSGNGISRSFQVGYIGQTAGAQFVDTNITPDFSLTPPIANNPFADGAIVAIDITAAGTNYTNASTLSVSDPTGTGFIGYPLVGTTNASASGPIVGFVILNGGEGYTAPVFTITVGSGATVSPTISDLSGNFPDTAILHNQREVYAATLNKPLTLFGSKPGQLSNFSFSNIIISSDSFEHEIDSDDASPVRHILPINGGLLVMSAAGIWLVNGSNTTAITPTNVQADPQIFQGVSEVPPIKILKEVLYFDAVGGKLVSLTYNFYSRIYEGADVSLLASHLLPPEKYITSACYSPEPYRQLFSCRSDGVLLLLTLIKDQDVYGWSRRVTQGDFKEVIALTEGNKSTVYVMVQRLINGRYTKFFETITDRNFTDVEDAFCVDCGLRLEPTYPNGTLSVGAATGDDITISSSIANFTAQSVGNVIRAGGGKAIIKTYLSPTSATVTIVKDFTSVISYLTPVTVKRFNSGEWTLDVPIQTVYGLSHLEGMTVRILADGNVVPEQTVVGGSVTLSVPATRIIIGLPFNCTARNLPLTDRSSIIENKRKRVVGITMGLKDTRGIKAGNTLEDLYELKDRTNELYGAETTAVNKSVYQLLEPVWGDTAQTYIVQDQPLPATILGYVLDVETGDD